MSYLGLIQQSLLPYYKKEEHDILSTLEKNKVEYQEVIEASVRCGHF